jgi:hypothetical protein
MKKNTLYSTGLISVPGTAGIPLPTRLDIYPSKHFKMGDICPNFKLDIKNNINNK